MTTLPNGLKIILKEDHTVPVVSLQAWARCGAIDETPNIYGISHGLEHMVFKGTPTRSAGEITKTIEGVGGYINAATQLETTHYYVDIPSYGLKPTLDVFADTILHPVFPADELERERLVILEEIRSREDNPDATLWDEFTENVFKGTPYAIRVIGTKKTVSALSQDDLFKFFRKNYVPSNKSLVVVGDFDTPQLRARLESLFAGEESDPVPERPAIRLGDDHGHRSTLRRPVQLSYIGMGIATPGLLSDELFALDVLADVVGGGASARLYQNLRETQRVVLSVSCDYIPFSQKGILSVFAETSPDKTEAAVQAIEDQFDRLESNLPSEAELNRAKARIKSEWLHGSETPRGQASTLGSLAVMDRLTLINDYLPRVEALTLGDIMRVYRDIVKGKKWSITQVLPQ